MKKSIKIFTGIIFISIICFFTWFLSNDVFSGDDIPVLSSWLTEGGKFNFDGILTSFIAHFFCKDLPLFFNIHPHTFSMTTGAFARAVNTAVLCLIIPLFMYIGREKTKFYPIAVIFSAFYFCYACSNIEFICFNQNNIPSYELDGSFVLLTEYSQHFGQLLSLIIGLLFFYIIVSLFVQNKTIEKKNIIFLSVFAFITAISSMFVNIVCGITLLSIGLYLAVLKSKSIAENKAMLLPFCSYLAGCLVFAFYPGYFKYLSFDINFFSFLKILFKNFVMANSLEFALVVILSAVLYLLAEKKSTYIKRTIYSVFFGIIGAFIYFGMFSFLDNNIAVFLTESQVLFRLFLLSMIFFLFGSCIKEHSSEPKELKILSIVFVFILFSFSFVQIPLIYSTMSIWKNMSEENKQTIYCIEKMYRFYSLIKKTALIPNDAPAKIYKVNCFLNDTTIDIDSDITNKIFFKHTSFTDGYYNTFYKNGQIVAYKFIDSKKALKIFFEEGGIIDAKEMKNLNFQKLYDDKFVLNRAATKQKQ